MEAGIDADKGLGTGILPDPATKFLRLAAVTISVTPVLNAGGFCPIALPNDQHTYAQCCRGPEFGLGSNARERRSSIAGRGVHASSDRAWTASCTSLKTDTCRGWLPFL